MTDRKVLDDLLAEVEESLEVQGFVGLYDFSWSLRGLRPDIPEKQHADICRAAYATLRSRRALRLVWVTWPVSDLADARQADDAVPLDFDLDPDAPVSTPLLALIPT